MITRTWAIRILFIAIATATVTFGNGCSQLFGFKATNENTVGSEISGFQSSTFLRIRADILVPKCLACHNSTLASGGVSFSDYESTMKTVVAGQPGSSRLLISTKNQSMPQSGSPLTGVELQNLENWILNGAKNDGEIVVPVAGKFFPVVQPELKVLTPREYDRALQVMLGLNLTIGQTTLLSNAAAPFDNDMEEFKISLSHVESYEYAATKAADAFLTSSTRTSYIPCVAQNATDRSCLEKFTVQLASVAYRSLVTPAELKNLVDLALATATREAKFDSGVRIVIQALLQNPRFLYRFENGVSKDGLYELTNQEFLSKATFFLLGRPPTFKELQEVSSGAFATKEAKDLYIQKLLSDPAVVDQMDQVHAAWMGYSALGTQSASAGFFRAETKALISKVLTDGLPWSTLLTSSQSYTNEVLAKTYGMDDQTVGWKWRPYKGSDRQGLLSQGSFLSVGVKFGDTSTTRRGYNIQKALFCGVIGHPPSVDENGVPINTDEPPPSETVYECKEDLYRNTVLSRKNCAACHNMMDSIAFGLENYGPDASFRTTEPGKPRCTIRGSGEVFVMSQKGLTKLGDFSGPKQLSDLALQSGYIERCLATRMSQFSMGRKPAALDEGMIYNVYALQKNSKSFKEFLKSFILSPEFSIRKGP